MNQSTLRLFKAIQINDNNTQIIDQHRDARSIKKGYIFDRRITVNEKVIKDTDAIIGMSGEQANAAFHKSWRIIEESSMETLAMQQMLHYLTTYGFQQEGIYRDETIFIPHETLEIPEMKKDVPITVIKAMTADEILTAIIKMASGIALSEQSLKDIMHIVECNKYAKGFVKDIKNRELLALLQDFYHIVPSEPIAFLRYVVSKITDESLLIKNDHLIHKIEKANGKFLDVLMMDAPDDLASIFFRFKPLFLAMKKASRNKNFYNQLRRQASQLHKAMPVDYLSQVTALIKTEQLNFDKLNIHLAKANVFRQIRLAYALKYRLDSRSSIFYKVRNGKGWSTDFEWSKKYRSVVKQAYEMVISYVINAIRKNVNKKHIYIPEGISYALPATEKQFSGHLPTGTYVKVPEDIIVGIHWKNTARFIDLDLAAIGQSGKIGWDSAYKNADNSVLFSGDMTSAPRPNGATELFYMKNCTGEARILTVNYYNFKKDDEVDCKILVAKEKPKHFKKNYMVNINNILATADIKINKKQNIIGLAMNFKGENRIYFCHTSVGNGISSRNDKNSQHIRQYLVDKAQSSINFRALLSKAGAYVYDQIPEGDYIDLSPEALDKSTILDLIY